MSYPLDQTMGPPCSPDFPLFTAEICSWSLATSEIQLINLPADLSLHEFEKARRTGTNAKMNVKSFVMC